MAISAAPFHSATHTYSRTQTTQLGESQQAHAGRLGRFQLPSSLQGTCGADAPGPPQLDTLGPPQPDTTRRVRGRDTARPRSPAPSAT